MKKLVYFSLFLSFLFVSCSEDYDDNLRLEENASKVALLKVDFLTQTFEGGQELNFDATTGFTITANYQPPGDFGSVKLIFNELGQPIFDGTIIWMGLGERSFPETLQSVSDFATLSEPVEMPSESMFENVMYDEFAYYPEDINYSQLWNSIKYLKIVEDYRSNNPDGTIQVFLYTPSVGYGNPAEWDYYLILHK